MFVPTIRYKRVNDESIDKEESQEKKPSTSAQPKPVTSSKATDKGEPATDDPHTVAAETSLAEPETSASSTEQPTVEVDPSDDERILVTLSNGSRYTADRYCPHAGADLSYMGEVAEDEYPPEIGPVLMCTLHYWEFALQKGGRSGGGIATLNACPVAESCPTEKNKELQW